MSSVSRKLAVVAMFSAEDDATGACSAPNYNGDMLTCSYHSSICPSLQRYLVLTLHLGECKPIADSTTRFHRTSSTTFGIAKLIDYWGVHIIVELNLLITVGSSSTHSNARSCAESDVDIGVPRKRSFVLIVGMCDTNSQLLTSK